MTLTFDLLTSKSIGRILDSWWVSVWSFMIIGWLQSQLSSGNHFQITMRHDLDLWPFDLKINRAHPWLMVSKCMKFHDHRLITESVTISPHSAPTFPGTCKRKFLCLQMISFEFLRVDSIGWIVSRGKHFVHMTRPGARDWPAACFPRPIFSHYYVYYDTTSKQVVMSEILPTIRSYFPWYLSCFCANSMDTYT